MTQIPEDTLPYFENGIYLPMLIRVLQKDRLTIEVSPFKLKGPYIKTVEMAVKIAQTDLKQTNIYLLRNNMKLYKKGADKDFTEYTFANGGFEDHRRYSNVRLRNRTEELLAEYLIKGTDAIARKHSWLGNKKWTTMMPTEHVGRLRALMEDYESMKGIVTA